MALTVMLSCRSTLPPRDSGGTTDRCFSLILSLMVHYTGRSHRETCWAKERERERVMNQHLGQPLAREAFKDERTQGSDCKCSLNLWCAFELYIKNTLSKNWDGWGERWINMEKTTLWILHSGLVDSLNKMRINMTWDGWLTQETRKVGAWPAEMNHRRLWKI